jgi:hypothetical protein
MTHAHKRAAVVWIALLSIAILTWAQVADESRMVARKAGQQ